MNRVALCALGLLPMNAGATGPIRGVPIQQDTSLERYANDLVGEDASDRLYAARVLRRRVREAWRLAGRSGADLRIIEARQTLSHFDILIAPRCIRQLSVPNTRKACAAILGMLETESALPDLHKAEAMSNSRSNTRAFRVAIQRIEGTE
jgi:hypothetical protein